MKFRSRVIVVLPALLLCFSLHAQQEYGISGKPVLKISGTSTLHDWDMISEKATGNAKISVDAGEVSAIHGGKFSMEAESIKSGKRQMDTNAYRAMKTDKHTQVIFQITEAKKQGSKWLVSGTLDLAGSKKPVVMESTLNSGGSSISLISTTAFKLTDFGITPPTAVMGTIKTGDDVTLTIEMTLQPIF